MMSTTRSARKRPAKSSRHALSSEAFVAEGKAAAHELAGFARVAIREMDAQMWSVHPVAWLQPELKPRLPGSSGLSIERHHRFPVPGLLDLQIAAVDPSHKREEHIPRELPPLVRHTLPESDLVPLGWDPRVVTRQQRNEVEK
jgi:hypothetical protein